MDTQYNLCQTQRTTPLTSWSNPDRVFQYLFVYFIDQFSRKFIQTRREALLTLIHHNFQHETQVEINVGQKLFIIVFCCPFLRQIWGRIEQRSSSWYRCTRSTRMGSWRWLLRSQLEGRWIHLLRKQPIAWRRLVFWLLSHPIWSVYNAFFTSSTALLEVKPAT